MLYFAAGEKQGWLHLFGAGDAPVPLVWLMAGEMTPDMIGRMESMLLPQIEAGVCRPFALCGFGPVDWDHDYAPWPLETPGGRRFGDGADALFIFAQSIFLPAAKAKFACSGECCVVGYSLGGLAALYAAGLGEWAGCGSCSGSTWYPGFTDWIKDHPPRCPVYLSLGGKEKNTRDPLMARVEECNKAIYDFLCPRVPTTFVHEPGGHFKAVEQRLANAILWLLKTDQSRKS